MSIFEHLLLLIEGKDLIATLLIILFVIALILCLFKFYFFYKVRLDVNNFLSGIFNNLKKNHIFECINLCDDLKDTPVAHLTRVAILKSPKGLEELTNSVDNEAIEKQREIEKGFTFIQTAIFLCPFLGLLGSFSRIAEFFLKFENTSTNISSLFIFIGQALVYVLLSLVFTIILYTFFNFLATQLKSILNDMSITRNRIHSFFSSQEIDTEKIESYVKPYDL